MQSSSGTMLAEALQWEIARALEDLEMALGEEDEGEEGTCEVASCRIAMAGRRAGLVKQVAQGEAAVLRALKGACRGGGPGGGRKRKKKKRKRAKGTKGEREST